MTRTVFFNGTRIISFDTLPCPFRCISTTHYIVKKSVPRRSYFHYNVHCGECGSCGPTSESAKGAVARWNERMQENKT